MNTITPGQYFHLCKYFYFGVPIGDFHQHFHTLVLSRLTHYKKWSLQHVVTSSKQGLVIVIGKEHRRRVLKFSHVVPSREASIRSERSMQRIFQVHDIMPSVYKEDSIVIQYRHYHVNSMKMLDVTLKELLLNIFTSDSDETPALQILLEQIRGLLLRLRTIRSTHGDFHCDNVMSLDGTLYLIDAEFSTIGLHCPEIDVYTLLKSICMEFLHSSAQNTTYLQYILHFFNVCCSSWNISILV
jgi:hypothetical protein